MEIKKKEKYRVKDVVPGDTAMTVITPFGMGTSYSLNLVLENDETFSMGSIPDYILRGILAYKQREAGEQAPRTGEESPQEKLMNRKSIDTIFMEPEFKSVRSCLKALIEEIIIDEGVNAGSNIIFRATAYTKNGEVNMVPSSAVYLSLISRSSLYVDKELHETIKKRNEEMQTEFEEAQKKMEKDQKRQEEEQKRKEEENKGLYA